MVVAAFQTACLAIIVLIAKFVGDLLYSYISDKSYSWRLLVFLILVSMLNFFEITNSWASIKKYFRLYDTLLFLIDVITLGVFFWQMHVLSKFEDSLQSKLKIVDDELEYKMVLVSMVAYEIIFILYILWNQRILDTSSKKDSCKLTEKETKSINSSVSMRWNQLVLLSSVSVLYAYRCISMFLFDIEMIVFILCVLHHNKNLDVFETIIKSTGKIK